MQLTRRFSPWMMLMLSINGTVGSAWLFAPLYAAKIAGSGAIVAWILSGLATALIALTFAELSVMFPVAGGSAQLPELSHGPLVSFVVSWTAWLSALTMSPIEVQAILQYASTYFPSLAYNHDGTTLLTAHGFVWATLLMLLFCFINIASFKGLERVNSALFGFKVGVIVLTIFALIHISYTPANFDGLLASVSTSQGWHAILVAIASGGVAFAFTGFKHGVELAGEAKRQSLGIPLAVVGSVLCCLVLYLGLQFAFIGALRPSQLAQGWSALSFVGDAGPFAGLALGLGLGWLAKLLYADAAISPAGAGLVYVTSTARILYAMSHIGFMPAFLSKLNKHQFPVAAIFFNFALGMLLFIPLGGWQAMVSFLVSGMVISYALGPIALLCLRRELPQFQRTFKLPMANVLCFLAFYFCNLLSYWTGWATISKFAIAVLIGLVIFALALWRGRIARERLLFRASYWVLPYLGGLVLLSYLGSFGGIGALAFGWDFLVIGLFSLAILLIAVNNRAPITETQLQVQRHLAEAAPVA